jgi:hypothetical protein
VVDDSINIISEAEKMTLLNSNSNGGVNITCGVDATTVKKRKISCRCLGAVHKFELHFFFSVSCNQYS